MILGDLCKSYIKRYLQLLLTLSFIGIGIGIVAGLALLILSQNAMLAMLSFAIFAYIWLTPSIRDWLWSGITSRSRELKRVMCDLWSHDPWKTMPKHESRFWTGLRYVWIGLRYVTISFKNMLSVWIAWLCYVVIAIGALVSGIFWETRKDDNQHDRIIASVDTVLHKHQPHYLFEEGTVFSLLYEQNGDPHNMVGICPVNANATWLKAFRTALRECTGEEDLKLEVSGLASTFPGHDDDSNKLNLKIANLRTVSIAALLLADSTPDAINDGTSDAINDDCLCGSSFSDRSVADTLMTHCEAAKKPAMDRPHHFTELPSDSPFVRYKLWTTFEQMHYNTQANDEQANDEQTSPDSGNHSALAFLNRSVRITMLNDACRY